MKSNALKLLAAAMAMAAMSAGAAAHHKVRIDSVVPDGAAKTVTVSYTAKIGDCFGYALDVTVTKGGASAKTSVSNVYATNSAGTVTLTLPEATTSAAGDYRVTAELRHETPATSEHIDGPFLIIDLNRNAAGKFVAEEVSESPDWAWCSEHGWMDEYKTRYLVLRKIGAQKNVWLGALPNGRRNQILQSFYSNEVRQVSASAYWIGVYKTTMTQYNRVMDRFIDQGSKKPVANVSYAQLRGSSDPSKSPLDGADGFFKRLCRDCVDKSGNAITGFDLPTEAQAEIAFRAGSADDFCFGNDLSVLPQYAWYGEHGDKTMRDVGLLRANAWGLYDVHGLAWEVCRDLVGIVSEETIDGKVYSYLQMDGSQQAYGNADYPAVGQKTAIRNEVILRCGYYSVQPLNTSCWVQYSTVPENNRSPSISFRVYRRVD